MRVQDLRPVDHAFSNDAILGGFPFQAQRWRFLAVLAPAARSRGEGCSTAEPTVNAHAFCSARPWHVAGQGSAGLPNVCAQWFLIKIGLWNTLRSPVT